MLDIFADVEPFHNLSTLRISSLGLSASAFVLLFGRSPNLQTLEMLDYFDQPGPIVEQFLAILRNHPRLRKLLVCSLGMSLKAMARRLFLSCGNLDKIELGLYLLTTETPVPTPRALLDEVCELTGSASPSFKVRDLKLSFSMELGEPYLDLLRMCPNVERFAMRVVTCGSGKDDPCPFILKSTMRALRHLTLYTTESSTILAAGLIDVCASLESYSDPEYMPNPQAVISALNRHHNTLTVVELRGRGLVWTPPGAVQAFLCTCPSLSKFSAKDSEIYQGLEQDIGRWSTSLWTCEGLKTLEIDFESRLVDTKISGSCSGQGSQLDQTGGSGDNASEFVPTFLVFQLGRMKKLEELVLRRVEAESERVITDILAMRKEQYEATRSQVTRMLTTLSTLPELRRVEFLGMEGTVDKDDVDNAKQNWKHIKSILYHDGPFDCEYMTIT